jgi:hypothetical protein
MKQEWEGGVTGSLRNMFRSGQDVAAHRQTSSSPEWFRVIVEIKVATKLSSNCGDVVDVICENGPIVGQRRRALRKKVERQFPTRVPFRPSTHRIPTLAARTERILKSHMANHLIFQFFRVRFGSARSDTPSSNPEPRRGTLLTSDVVSRV